MKIDSSSGPISHTFSQKGISEFKHACEWVQQLPYHRNSTKEDHLIVLKEMQGTCSSKHELIKRLAEENELLGCSLVLCMFKMSGLNTPKIGDVLSHYGLDYIPEAHTYILLDDEILDLTFPEKPPLDYLKEVIFTKKISADQIKHFKSSTHRSYLRQWVDQESLPYSLKEIWEIREECIQRLSQ